MNKVFFDSSLNTAKQLLEENGLLKSNGFKPLGETSEEFKQSSIKGSYIQAYEVAKRNLDFDVLLQDESFFQFSFKEGESLPKIRYAFFQNPQDYVSYDDFLNTSLNTTYEDAGELFIEEHSQYLTELDVNTSTTMIRYDLDSGAYEPLIHSASHLHIGNSEDLRIPINKIWTPLSFVVFVIKHIYYRDWKNLIQTNHHFAGNYLDTMKSQCTRLEARFWSIELETKDFFLG